jgi:hypothetical protein
MLNDLLARLHHIEFLLGFQAQTGGIDPTAILTVTLCHRLRSFDEVTANVTSFRLLSVHF